MFRLLSLLFLTLQPQPPGEPRLYIHENQIWVGRGRDLQQITDDELHKSNLVLSPSADTFAYIAHCDSVGTEACPPTLVFRKLNGDLLYSFAPLLEDSHPCLSVMAFEWIDNNRVGLVCHVNPSISEYAVVSVHAAKVTAGYYGGPFSWSPDRRKLAYGGPVPHFAPPYIHSFYLCVDRRVIYPTAPVRHVNSEALFPRSPNSGGPNGCDIDYSPSVVELHGSTFMGIHELFSDLGWAPNGTAIAFVEQTYDWEAPAPSALNGGVEVNQRYQAVGVGLDGKSQAHILDGATRQPYSVEWLFNERFEIRADSGTHWIFDRRPEGFTLRSSPEPK
ncbi:MAG: hypothetical protein WB992_03245 [Bryobacteraceae bacterium]